MLSETDFDERRNVNKRKKLILEGKNPEEEAKKKERYLDKKRKAARKEMHKMQKQRKLEEQDVVWQDKTTILFIRKMCYIFEKWIDVRSDESEYTATLLVPNQPICLSSVVAIFQEDGRITGI